MAREFSPLKLKAVRQSMIESGLARTTINQRIGRIVHIFKWAASEELVSAQVHQTLKTVSGLQKGRTQARESEPVRPVPDAHVDAIRSHVSRQVWAMIELQRATGMRPGEVVRMRTQDIDRAGPVWVYTPDRHKAEHHGKGRPIYLGPRAQEILSNWLRGDPTEPLFQPREAMAELRREQRRNRKTPLHPSVLARTPKNNPKKSPGVRYTPRTYYHAIQGGCTKAGVPSWHPHQLGHNAATRLRKEFGLDTARVVLGHASPIVTEVYAERDEAKAMAAMEKIG
jgi:integrase